MALSFKSVGHFFATVFQDALSVVGKVESTATAVEAATSVIPIYGPLGLTVEKAGYAVLGELSAVLTAGGAAAKAKLADAGLDANVVATIEALIAAIPQAVAVAKKK